MSQPGTYLQQANQRNPPANHYLNELGSQVDMIRIEPGPAGGMGWSSCSSWLTFSDTTAFCPHLHFAVSNIMSRCNAFKFGHEHDLMSPQCHGKHLISVVLSDQNTA